MIIEKRYVKILIFIAAFFLTSLEVCLAKQWYGGLKHSSAGAWEEVKDTSFPVT